MSMGSKSQYISTVWSSSYLSILYSFLLPCGSVPIAPVLLSYMLLIQSKVRSNSKYNYVLSLVLLLSKELGLSPFSLSVPLPDSAPQEKYASNFVVS